MSTVLLVLLSARVSTLSVGEGTLPPGLESTPAVKKPLAVVRPCSHIPSFGGHSCPGVLRPVPADGDLSSSSSGSILPSLFSILTHTSGDGSGAGGQGLECCTVSTCVTVTCTCGASRLRLSTYSLILANSKFESSSSSESFCQGLVTVFLAGIEIASFNVFNSSLRPAWYS